MCASVQMRGGNVNMCLLFRFFLMYLINKDETEHTGQVRLKNVWGIFSFIFSFLISLCPLVFLF